jgi:nucleotide-binding universal stress UspA family protein
VSTIVFGYTLTDEGEAALEAAIDEAKLREARLEVLHSRREGTERDIEDMHRVEEALQVVSDRLEAEGIDHAIHFFVRGASASEDVVALARETGADFIIIGLRHRTRTGKFLLGSTAQSILLDAPCPVLAVKVALRPD